MKTRKLLFENMYNEENYNNIVNALNDAAREHNCEITVEGSDWYITAGNYDGALMDIEHEAIAILEEYYPEIF